MIGKIENAHKLLRVVWVFIEHTCEGRPVAQGELPKELAKELSDIPEDKLDDKDKLGEKVNRPLTCDHVKEALDKLEEIFNTISGQFELPWPYSNPCAGARPRFRI